jgi:hypothetical protein
VKVERDGFSTELRTGLTLDVAQELVVNAELKVGSTNQEVTVTGDVPLVDTTNGQLGGMVSQARIAELPLNGRNYTDLTYMQPGISINPHVNSSAQTGGLHGTAFNSDGLLGRQNIYLMDGATMVSARGLGPVSESGTSIGVAGIKEFKVVTGAFDASYGFSPGAQVIVVSKNGTNQFHGEAFEYIRNNALDAANYFDKPVQANGFRRLPAFRRNNFGGGFGGPIKKNRMFFFAAYEGLRQNLGQTVVDLVPGAGCHGPNGDNTGVVTAQACPELGTGAAPVTIAPVMKGLLSLYPVPNLPNNQFTFGTGTPTQVDWGQMRVDDTISDSDTIFGRYTMDKSYSETQVLGNTATQNVAFPQFAANYVSLDQFATISENHIFSPKLLNQLRFSYSRTFYSEGNLYPTNQFSPNGIASVTGPLFSFSAGQPTGRISFTGYPTNGINASNPQRVPVNHYVPSDDVFLTKGKHALKFGTQINRENLGQHQNNTQGQITFTSLPNFLKGIAGSTQNIFGPNQSPTPDLNRNWYWWIPQFYFQDDWKVTDRLTLNLGARYSFVGGLHETGGKNWNLRNRATDTAFTNGPSAFAPFSKNHFEPRLGFAWDVTGDGKTSFRGGAGIYHDFQLTGLTLTGIISTPPLAQTIIHSGDSNPITLPFTFTLADFSKGVSSSSANFYFKNPTVYKWNLEVERQLPYGFALQTAYVGSRALHNFRNDEGNPISPTAITGGLPYWNGTGARINTNFAAGSMENTAGRSVYHALQVSANKRASRFEMQLSYTYSKTLDDTDGLGNDCVGAAGMSQPIYFGPGALPFNYGPACTNIPHNLRVNWTYHFQNIQADNFTANFLKGWWIGSIWSANSGYPFTPMLTSNRSKSGNFTTGADRVSLATAADASFCQSNPGLCKYQPIPFDRKKVITDKVTQWFNPNMFVLSPITTAPGNGVICTAATCSAPGSAYATLGNASRGMLRGPSWWNADLSINKDTRLKWLGEAGSLEFRAEIFNLFNHPNFNEPNANIFAGSATDFSPYSEAPSSSAGLISSTSTTSRQTQFALKLVF